MCARVSTKYVKSINIGIEKLFQTVPTTLYPPIANFFLLEMEGAIPPPRPVITPRKLEILYFPSLPHFYFSRS